MSPQVRPRPRPILKQSSSPPKLSSSPLPFSSCPQILSPHVHFPPTPGLVSTHPALPAEIYDRAPIVVSPNICEIPVRNDRRIRSPAPPRFEIEQDDHRGRSRQCKRREAEEENVKGSYFHPRAFEACEPEPIHDYIPPSATLQPPPLIRDLSPDEDDDEIITPHDLAARAWTPLPPNSYSSPTNSGNVYVSSNPSLRSSSFDSARSSKDIFQLSYVTADSQKHRPSLDKMENTKRSLRRVKGFSSQMDEGCLGGF